MKVSYWVVALVLAGFLGWAHDHTDEIPIMFGFVLIAGAILGALAPQRYLVSWLIVTLPMPFTETLVHYRWINAPYPPGEALPLAALIAGVPALIGVAIGFGLRRLTGGSAAIP